jgi:hypothetical protein
MSWIERYFPKNYAECRPNSPEEIAEIFPSGEYEDSRGQRLSDRNVWAEHSLIRMFNDEEKTKEFPEGRTLMVAGGGSAPAVVLMDEVYWIAPEREDESPIARVKYGLARCFPRDGEIWADGFPHHSRSAQRIVNMTVSQMVDRREHSLFGLLATKGMNLLRELKNTLAGMIWRWSPDPLAPGEKPQFVQMALSDTSGLNEIKYQEESIHGDLGVNDADIGGLKDLASTPYSMYALAKESTGERREPRLKEGLEAIRVVLKHALVLKARYEREPRKYRVKAADGWEIREYLGSDIAGETDVKIKEEPFFDEKAAQRDATSKAVEMQQLQLPTKRAQREYFKTIGVPEALLDESNVQLEKVQRDWMAWYRTGRPLIVDPTMDDVLIYHQELGRLLLSDEGIEKAEAAKWDEALDLIIGWQDQLAILQDAIPGLKGLGWRNGQPVIQQGEPTMDPLTGQEIPGQTINLLDQAAQQAYQAQLAQAAQIDQQNMAMAQQQEIATQVPGIPPQPTVVPEPQPSEFVNTDPLKEGLQHLVSFTLKDMLLRAGADISEEREAYISIRSAYEAYRILGTAQTGMAPAAPGTDLAAPAAAGQMAA